MKAHEKVFIGQRDPETGQGTLKIQEGEKVRSLTHPPRTLKYPTKVEWEQRQKEFPTAPKNEWYLNIHDQINWGYPSTISGGQQLALTLLWETTGCKDTSRMWYYNLYQQFVIQLPPDGWKFSERKIQDWLAEGRISANNVKEPPF